jgi:hypothetical protein
MLFIVPPLADRTRLAPNGKAKRRSHDDAFKQTIPTPYTKLGNALSSASASANC